MLIFVFSTKNTVECTFFREGRGEMIRKSFLRLDYHVLKYAVEELKGVKFGNRFS